MGVKEALIRALEANRGAYLSGAELARQLGVSRNAVWKAVGALSELNHEIETAPGKGYRLAEGSDRLSVQSIERHLTDPSAYALTVKQAVDSTNALARELAARGAPEFTVVIAERQSAGRGRMRRAFYSPEGTGIYLSVIVRPRLPAQEALFLTTMAAVAVCEAIEEACGRPTSIKWVNDVLLDGGKVCGILTEAQLDLESGALEYAVVGIGINARPPEGGFPEAIKDIARAVFGPGEGAPGARSRLAAGVLNRFRAMYAHLPERSFLAAYRARSAVVGHRVLVLQGDRTRRALALSIEDNCALRVRYEEDGREEALSSGEVSTKLEETHYE